MYKDRYRVVECNIISNSKDSTYINTIGFNKIFLEIPSLTSFCIQSKTNFFPKIYDSNRNSAALGYYTSIRTQTNFESQNLGGFFINSTPGNIILELPKSFSGIKSLYFSSGNTMTSTCTLRVHVSG